MTVADTTRPVLLFETNLHTRCPYKGQASYWSAKVNGSVHENIAWAYPDPIPEMPKIKDLLAFYNEKLDIYVDGVLQERPHTYWS